MDKYQMRRLLLITKMAEVDDTEFFYLSYIEWCKELWGFSPLWIFARETFCHHQMRVWKGIEKGMGVPHRWNQNGGRKKRDIKGRGVPMRSFKKGRLANYATCTLVVYAVWKSRHMADTISGTSKRVGSLSRPYNEINVGFRYVHCFLLLLCLLVCLLC